MRSGGYTIQQSLTLEAASVVKQAISLARRRGHAQVTPIHVASAMLAPPTGLLKRACLKSHSHPLQCKALELCFNVALNRLPTSASSPLLGPHSHLPSLSNALVAAFKRAQAHQRRGSIENQQQQQQQILALKVEIEQLVISILDDPSVSRVMREAGFSSTQVKTNVEQAVSVETKESSTKLPLVLGNNVPIGKTIMNNNQVIRTNDDVMDVLEAMMNKKTKNTVIISECDATAESLVKRVIEKFDKRDVPDGMKFVQFISVPLVTLRNVSKDEFEVKLGELRALVKSYMSRGVVLYLGNLDWVSEFWSNHGSSEQRNYISGYVSYYSPVEYMIMELSRLIYGEGGEYACKKLWLMGTANSETYAKCRTGRPSLETLWSLHPLRINIPVIGSSLALTLSLDSEKHELELKKEPVDDNFSWLFNKGSMHKHKQLDCCSDCSMNFKREAHAMMTAKQELIGTSTSSTLPSWLQLYKDESKNQVHVDQESDKMKDLSKKWNSICSSVHKKRPHFLEKPFELSSSSSPSSSTSISSNSHKKPKLDKTLINWPVIFEGGEVSKPDLLSNPNSSPNSASSSEASDQDIMDLIPHKFKNPSSENLNILCTALEKKVPWQGDIIPDIADTILKSRSGVTRSRREDTWMFFLGADSDGKEAIARELAKIVFRSYESFVSIGLSSFMENKPESSDEVVSNNKRARDGHGGSPYERFLDAVHENPSRVFFVEDVDQLDNCSLKGFEGVIRDGDIGVVKNAIVIFSCERFDKGEITERNDDDDDQMRGQCVPLDLNIATEDDGSLSGNNGILDLVDKKVVFSIHVL